MNTLTLLKNISFNPETHECHFQSFDEQLANRIFMDSDLYIDDFEDPESVSNIYDYIGDNINERLAELGFALPFPEASNLVDNVYDILKDKTHRRGVQSRWADF